MRVDQCVSAIRAVEVPVLVCLRSSCSHVTEVKFVRLALKVVMQNDRGFVDVILLHFFELHLFLSKSDERSKHTAGDGPVVIRHTISAATNCV